MKKLLVFATMLALNILGINNISLAQDNLQPKKNENVQWQRIVLLKFTEGKFDRAKAIIKDYFEKAGEKSQTPGPSLAVNLVTGEWDMMVVWDMKGGIEDLNWELSPDDVKWMKAMNEVAGSADKAKAIQDEFSGLITRSTSYLGKKSK